MHDTQKPGLQAIIIKILNVFAKYLGWGEEEDLGYLWRDEVMDSYTNGENLVHINYILDNSVNHGD